MYGNDATMTPFHAVTERPVRWPTVSGGTDPGTGIPIHAMPIIVKNNVQLAQKPASLPPHPTITQTLTALPLSLQFAFQQVTPPTGATNVMSSYRVYRNTSANNFSGAQLMRTFVHDPTRQGAITVQDNTGGGKTYYYFLTSVDTTGQESTPVGAQSGAIVSGNANPNLVQSTQSGQTTSSVTDVAIGTGLKVTLTTKGNPVLVLCHNEGGNTTSGALVVFNFYRDNVLVSGTQGLLTGNGTNESDTIAFAYLDTVAAGTHTYEVKWHVSAGTGSQFNGTLQALELG